MSNATLRRFCKRLNLHSSNISKVTQDVKLLSELVGSKTDFCKVQFGDLIIRINRQVKQNDPRHNWRHIFWINWNNWEIS